MNDQNQRVYMGNDDAGNPIYGEYVGSDAVGNPIFGVFQGYDAYKQPVFSGICGQDGQGRPIWDTMGFNEQGQLVYGIPAVYDVNGNPLPQPAEQTTGGFTEAGKEPGKVRPRLHITPLMVMIMLAVIGLTAWFCYEQFAPQAARYGAIELASINATHTGDALIARNEAPYTADGVTSITYIAEEGSEVAQETRICQVYSAGFSTREVTTLQSYQEEIRDYQKDLITSAISDARMDRLMSEVTGHLRELRGRRTSRAITSASCRSISTATSMRSPPRPTRTSRPRRCGRWFAGRCRIRTTPSAAKRRSTASCRTARGMCCSSRRIKTGTRSTGRPIS